MASPAAHPLPRRPLVPVAVAAGLGVAADRGAAVGLAGWWLAVAGLAAWLALRRAGRDGHAAIALLLAVGTLAAGWSHASWRLFCHDEVGRYARERPQPVCLDAVALDTPRSRDPPAPSPLRAIPATQTSEIPLAAGRLRLGERWKAVSGRLLLVVDGDLAGVRAGDLLRVHGQVRAGPAPLNPGQFDYGAYLRGDRQLAVVRAGSPDCVSVVRRGSWSPWRGISSLRTELEQRLAGRLGPDRAAVAGAVLLGARRAVDEQTTGAFRRTGSLHVLVVSGLHVGLVVSLLAGAAGQGWLPRRPTLLVVMAAIAGYALLTGARPPVVRAAVLGEVLCLAALTGRPMLSLNSLAGAAVAVLAYNPAELLRSGAQLSFLAGATLIALTTAAARRPAATAMDRLVAGLRPWPVRLARLLLVWLGVLLAATLAVWLVSAPLLLSRFHLLSPIALPLSAAVFPLVAAIVGGGVLLVLCEALAPPVVAAPAWGVGVAIDALTGVVRGADRLPGACFWHAGPAGWWTVGFYLAVVGWLLSREPRGRARWAKAAAAWAVLGVGAAVLAPGPPNALRASFISVGHGCSALIETPEGATLLYDAGSLGSPAAAADTISGVLWARGVSRIDALVISHADVDHFNATPELLRRFAVGGVYVAPGMFAEAEQRPGSAPAALLRAIESCRAPLVELRQGDLLRVGSAGALVLHPSGALPDASDNARSLVLAIERGDRRLLLPGDLEGPGLADVIAQWPWDCDVLLAPHHGSRRSDPPGFAAWSTPEWVVVSGGPPAASRQAQADAGATYRAAGAKVLRTAEHGMLRLTLSPAGVTCDAWRGMP